jgi:hypothetical protein
MVQGYTRSSSSTRRRSGLKNKGCSRGDENRPKTTCGSDVSSTTARNTMRVIATRLITSRRGIPGSGKKEQDDSEDQDEDQDGQKSRSSFKKSVDDIKAKQDV